MKRATAIVLLLLCSIPATAQRPKNRDLKLGTDLKVRYYNSAQNRYLLVPTLLSASSLTANFLPKASGATALVDSILSDAGAGAVVMQQDQNAGTLFTVKNETDGTGATAALALDGVSGTAFVYRTAPSYTTLSGVADATVFYNDDGDFSWWSNASERMRLVDSGTPGLQIVTGGIGVGTAPVSGVGLIVQATTPTVRIQGQTGDATLQVYGNGAGQDSMIDLGSSLWRFQVDNTAQDLLIVDNAASVTVATIEGGAPVDSFRVTSSGVGIGMTSPLADLHVENAGGDGTDAFAISQTGGGVVFEIQEEALGITMDMRDSGGTVKHRFRTGGGDSYWNQGQVGFGTTSPDSSVHVIGGLCVESSDSACAAASGSGIFDEVGIGTATPDSTLHVIGGLCVESSDSGCAAAAGDTTLSGDLSVLGGTVFGGFTFISDCTLDASGDYALPTHTKPSLFVIICDGNGGASDDFNHLTGDVEGDIVVIRQKVTANQLTIKHNVSGSGRFVNAAASDYTMLDRSAMGVYISRGTIWDEIVHNV